MIIATAPATLMLLGEHAVLKGGSAIACALDQYMRVELTPRKERYFTITSSLGEFEGHLDRFETEKPFVFILESILTFVPFLVNGFDLKITSDFSDQIGFGSSSAVTAASLGVLNAYTQQNYSFGKLAELGKKLTQKIQGEASGMDVMTSILGGVIFYDIVPQKLDILFPIEVVYSGYKVTTAEVLAKVREKDFSFDRMKTITFEGKNALLKKDLSGFARAMKAYQLEMRKLNLETEEIIAIIEVLEKDVGIFAAKISGSGLGDSVIGLGHLTKKIDWKKIHPEARSFDLFISKQGLYVETI